MIFYKNYTKTNHKYKAEKVEHQIYVRYKILLLHSFCHTKNNNLKHYNIPFLYSNQTYEYNSIFKIQLDITQSSNFETFS